MYAIFETETTDDELADLLESLEEWMDARADEAGSYDGPNAAIMAMSEAILQAFGRPLQ